MVISPLSSRSADIALVAGGNRKRWIIATENMQAGDLIKTSGTIGRMAGQTGRPGARHVCQQHRSSVKRSSSERVQLAIVIIVL